MDKSVEMVVLLKVDAVLDQKRLQIPDLMVRNVLVQISLSTHR